jgi:hypothetical protein
VTTADDDAREGVPTLAEPTEPRWPDDSAESAMLTEVRARDTAPAAAGSGHSTASSPTAVVTDQKKLPPLDPLVARLPADVRTVLDELFRAKFTAVRRVPENALR